ncbi:peptidoglycan-binding protein [Candidatus Kaiserbacteria bacterium]|nr:peptidoglycan-binding protein [Candidatus Kaiserbacteria bacterium]
MYRYLNNKFWSAPILAGVVVGALIMQLILPVIVFAADDIADPTPAETSTVVEVDGEEETVTKEAATPTEPESTTEEEQFTPASVETGDAVASQELENNLNENLINSDEETTTEKEVAEAVAADNLGESNPASIDTDDKPDVETASLPEVDDEVLTVTATNTATTTNNATTTANTGSNTVTGHEATIDTGDAIAYVDVLNVVNTNIVDSDGLIKFVNDSLGYDNFDLREDFELVYADFEMSESTPSCSLETCASAETNISLDNDATIENNILVEANSGNNTAAGDGANITTGNAYASANIINVANTNIADSNYLLLVFNNFADYAGDIVLPNSNFFKNLTGSSGGVSNIDVDINNTAAIDNNTEVVSNTGDNEAAGANTSIQTGNASSLNQVDNIVNQNIIGDNVFSLLIRVHGDWSGNITGLPDGFSWQETPEGIRITAGLNNNQASDVSTNLAFSAKNTAKINNNVQVYALTGDNKVTGDDTKVKTGDAHAESSILNIANTNVIGSNWSNLIFNIYGNWSGDLAFGQPDLWLGVTASSPDKPIMPTSRVSYTFTVFNRGDTTAEAVKLESTFESNALSFDDNNDQTNDGQNTRKFWNLGDIKAGETVEFTSTAKVREAVGRNVITAIPLSNLVSTTQKESDYDNNKEIVTIYVGNERDKSDSPQKTFPAHFDIKKTASRNIAQPGDVVDYTVTFFNRGGQLFDAVLVDVLRNEAGEIVYEQSWPFEEIKNWETITVSYSIEFDSALELGTYTNSAQLIGFHRSKIKNHQFPYESPIATHELQIGAPDGRVLGISDSFCDPYLTEYLRYGRYNNPNEVTRLQIFLNNHLDLNISTAGYFDLATEQAVRDFQQMYRDEVLIPWGLERDSGYVYYTTQKKINEIMCEGTKLFPLNDGQQAEISAFRARVTNSQPPLIETNDLLPIPELPANPNNVPIPNSVQHEVERQVKQIQKTVEPSPSNLIPTETKVWDRLGGWFQSWQGRAAFWR